MRGRPYPLQRARMEASGSRGGNLGPDPHIALGGKRCIPTNEIEIVQADEPLANSIAFHIKPYLLCTNLRV